MGEAMRLVDGESQAFEESEESRLLGTLKEVSLPPSPPPLSTRG
jgi:hypothetical protein